MNQASIHHPPLIAIVGAGPSAFYAAAEVLNRLPSARVNIFDRLPAPGGLARYGVSPDHAERRRMVAHYESLVMGSGRVSFIGDVHIGTDISIEELRASHDATVFACGCAQDQRLGIDGEDLPGSHPASQFVGWYNGHPDHAARRFNLDVESAVVVGNGNVALDAARMLLLDPNRLAATDIAGHALDALRQSRVREVVILGRRGPAESSFTTPELLELFHLDEMDVVVQAGEGLLRTADAPPGDIRHARDYAQHLKLRLLRELANRPARGRERRLVLRFLASPLALLGKGHVQALQIGHNELVSGHYGRAQARPTGRSDIMATGLVLRSVGYRGTALPGLPFDPVKGTLPHQAGRVVGSEAAQALPGVYVVGWQKRGPSGVIGSNKVCAVETVTALVEDIPALIERRPLERRSLTELLQRLPQRPVSYGGWKTIDRAEKASGERQGRPRNRLVTVEAMRSAAA